MFPDIMDSFFSIIVASVVTALLVEMVMLEIFRRKILGIEFPEQENTSFFRFFTLTRVSFLVSLHAVFMSLIFVGAYLFV